MTYRRAAIPALTGGLLLTALLWWAGASAEALHLAGSNGVLGVEVTAELDRWLAPWSYAPTSFMSLGDAGRSGGTGDYLSLYTTAAQIRFAAVFASFVPGALLLVRRLPPVRGRVTASLLAVWAWGMVAGMLAMTVSAPWLIASMGHGSYRLLPQLSGVIASGRQMPVVAALVAAVVTVLVARVTAKGAGPVPQNIVPERATRLAATVGTAVIAVSLAVLSYGPVAAEIQMFSPHDGMFSEPGELLRQWLLLGFWDFPSSAGIGSWLVQRTADALLLAVVWVALRRLPVLLTRATLPAMALGAVGATVLGLLASRLLRIAVDDSGAPYGVPQLFAGLGDGLPAALLFGLVAGGAATVALRTAVGRAEAAGVPDVADVAGVAADRSAPSES
ncbi:hypothetical protein ACFV9E_09580 [Streptomyces sp. NPDC059835]|uniref:hypothetical protein n=1 Tax=Streptomyces sp. NPDC059835 TaxID=3346967 RepID=UPI00364FA818